MSTIEATRPAVDPVPANRFDAVYAGTARFLGVHDEGVVPWEIAAPQPCVVELAAAGLISGTVLDVGCGTGENALHLAGLGLDVVGLDASSVAIGMAETKATARGLPVDFRAADASAISEWPERFDTVLLSGVLHLFSAWDRRRLAAGVHACVRPGGRLYVLCFSERARPPAPRLTHRQIGAAFRRHWQIEWSAPACYRLVGCADEANAWLLALTPRSRRTPLADAHPSTTTRTRNPGHARHRRPVADVRTADRRRGPGRRARRLGTPSWLGRRRTPERAGMNRAA